MQSRESALLSVGCLFHQVVWEKIFKLLISTTSANVTSLLITLSVPDDPSNSNKSLYTCSSQSVYED